MLTKIVKTAESVLAVLVYFGIFLLENLFVVTILTNVKKLLSFSNCFFKKNLCDVTKINVYNYTINKKLRR